MNIKRNGNVSKNNTICAILVTSNVVYENDVLDQNIIGMYYPILMKILSTTTKKVRRPTTFIFIVVTTKTEIFRMKLSTIAGQVF